MSAEVITGVITMDGTKSTGGITRWFDAGATTQGIIPDFIYKNTFVLDYRVPTGKVLTIENILVSMNAPYQGTVTTLGSVSVAKCELLIDGSPVAEWYDQDTGLAIGGQSNCNPESMQLGRWPLQLGEGIDITSGQTVAIRVTPTTANPCRFNISLYGMSGSTPINDYVAYVSDSTTSAQTAYTYTVPAGGLTLRTISCEGSRFDAPLVGFVGVAVSGRLVYEAPLAVQLEKPIQGQLNVPFFGLKAYEGNAIQVDVSDLSRIGVVYRATVFGTMEDMNTGGGGSGGSFAFVT
jgi:hypothetical protein